MPDDLIPICMGRPYYEQLPAFRPGGALVGRLAPAARIEAGPVECQAVWLDCTDSGRCFEAIAILEIQALGGWHAFNFTANPASRAAIIVCGSVANIKKDLDFFQPSPRAEG
jgi:hypothetical protein